MFSFLVERDGARLKKTCQLSIRIAPHSRPRSRKLVRYVHGELRLSLGVDGEMTETARLPAPGPFDAVVFDE